MIRGLKLAVVICGLWSAYWALAAWGIHRSVDGWFAEQSRKGWQVETGQMDRSGYPLRHVTRIPLPALADPASGIAWSADWLELESPAIWPGRQTLRFSPGEQRLSYYDRTTVIRSQDLEIALVLAPGLALEVERLALNSGPVGFGGTEGDALSAEGLTLAMEQQDEATQYSLSGAAQALRPSADLRRLLRSTDALPEQFETFEFNLDVRFDTPWDRRALETSRPQPRHIALHLAEAHWGAMRLKVSGDLTVDEAGVPTGTLAFQAEAWREFLQIAEETGLIAPQIRETAERVLGMLARSGGNADDLDISLSFRDGYIALGPFPLGPAPRLVLR